MGLGEVRSETTRFYAATCDLCGVDGPEITDNVLYILDAAREAAEAAGWLWTIRRPGEVTLDLVLCPKCQTGSENE